MDINDRGEKSLVARSREGGISLPSGSSALPLAVSGSDARSDDRAKKSPYSDEFEACWRAYGRKEEKIKAYARWKTEARVVGGEAPLRDLILAALLWQAPGWAADGWRFAKYFERYLKARKWEDEPMPSVGGQRRPATRGEGTIENLGAWLAKGAGKL